MESNPAHSHQLIIERSDRYVEALTQGYPSKTFDRGSVAAAYILGAEEALGRICSVIRYSADIGGISPTQSRILLRIVDAIESGQLNI